MSMSATARLLERQTSGRGVSTEKDLMSFLQNRNLACQCKVFRKWIIVKLKQSGVDVASEIPSLKRLVENFDNGKATEEFMAAAKDGTLLCRLYEILSGRKVPEHHAQPADEDQATHNITVGLQSFASEGAGVAGYDPKTLYSGKPKEVLNVFWTILLRYQVGVGQDTLLKWCSECCVPLGVTVTDFTASWLDGRPFAALAATQQPDLFEQGALATKNKFKKEEICAKAFSAGEALGIPQLLEASDLGEHTPDRVIITYVSFYYDLFGPPAVQRALKARAKELQRKVEERDRQLNQASSELRYLVSSHQEIRGLLDEQKKASKEAARKVLELSLQLPFYSQSTLKGRIPPPEEGNITIVLTSIHGSNVLWESVPDAMEQALRLHNLLMINAIEGHGGYRVSMDGGVFTVAFSSAVSALRFCSDIQQELLNAEWPEEILATAEACPDSVTVTDENGNSLSKVVFKGLRVQMAVGSGELLCQQDAFGRASYSGQEASLASSLLYVANPGQILLTSEALKNLQQELDPEAAPATSESLELRLDEDSTALFNLAGHINVTEDEKAAIYYTLPKEIADRAQKYTSLSEAKLVDAVDVRKVLLAKVEDLQVQNLRLKERLAEMEVKANTATMRADELLNYLSRCSVAPRAEDSLPVALENVKSLLEESRALKETLAMVRKQNDSMAEYTRRLAMELKELSFDQKLMTTKYNQLARLHQNSVSTIQQLKKERDALLKKLGKKGLFTKLIDKVSGKKDKTDVPTVDTTEAESTEVEEIPEKTSSEGTAQAPTNDVPPQNETTEAPAPATETTAESGSPPSSEAAAPVEAKSSPAEEPKEAPAVPDTTAAADQEKPTSEPEKQTAASDASNATAAPVDKPEKERKKDRTKKSSSSRKHKDRSSKDKTSESTGEKGDKKRRKDKDRTSKRSSRHPEKSGDKSDKAEATSPAATAPTEEQQPAPAPVPVE